MRTRSLLFTLCLCSATLPAAISSYGAGVVRQINAMLDTFQPNAGFQAGRIAGREAEARNHLQQVENLASQCNGQLRLLIRDSREPEAVAAAKRIKEVEAYIEDVRKGLQSSGQSNEQIKQMTFAFVQQHLGPAANRVHGLINLHRFPDSNQAVTNVSDLKEAIATLEAIDAACKGPFQPVANEPHPYSDLNLEPRTWCQAAAQRGQLARRSVQNLATASFSVFINEIKRMKTELERREGFLQTDITPIRRALWDRQGLEREMREKYVEHTQLVGLDVSSLLAPLDPAIDELMAEVQRLAPQWKFPAAGPRDPGPEAMARSQIARMPGSAVRASVMRDSAFSIRKNALGIPLERSKDGFVLYKMANEKLCRQQSFAYYEKFDGTGYQKPDGVQMNYVRYLNCQ